MRRVVVTGLGALTPIGNSTQEFWQNLIDGKSGIAPITSFDTTNFKTKIAAELKNYDPKAHFDRKELKAYDKFTQYALITVKEALIDTGLDLESIDKTRTGVIWGSGNGGIQTQEEQISAYATGDGTPRFNPFFIPRMLVDMAAGVIAMQYGFRGVNYCPVSACASSTTAIIDAFNYIKWNKADIIVSGGSDAPICASTIGGFNSLKALSTKNENPEQSSIPFDINRDGFVMGEGAGALILEEYEHAKKRGAKIYCEVVGGGMAADAYHLTGTHPEGDGAVLGMKLALEEANVKPADLDYLNMHATSTPLGDKSELIAIDRVFESSLSVSGTKSMTGHLLGAAGAIEAIATVLSCKENTVPPTINTKEIDPDFKDKFHFPLDKAEKKEVNYAMSNTFGFGGHIAALLVKKFTKD